MDKSDAGEVSAVEWWAAREDRMPNTCPTGCTLPASPHFFSGCGETVFPLFFISSTAY